MVEDSREINWVECKWTDVQSGEHRTGSYSSVLSITKLSWVGVVHLCKVTLDSAVGSIESMSSTQYAAPQ